MSIRLATRTDEAIVAALRYEWTVEERGAIPPGDGFEARFHEWFAREADHRRTWLACAGDDHIGMLSMLVFTRMPRPGTPSGRTQWGYVANVFVLESHRGRGWGSKLMDACIAHAAEHRYARLVLHPSARSIPFHERAGFTPATSLMIHSLE